MTRAPVDRIAAPLFPHQLAWVNTSRPISTLERGRPLLVEFWDFCRPNSLRTLPYVKAWHERYASAGLRVVGVHCPGFEPSREESAVRAAVRRLGIAYPVLIDSELELWREYENLGWPARYLFDGRARLFDFHYGEGASNASPSRPCGPRTRRAPCSRLRRPTSRAHTAGHTRPGACGPCSTEAARCRSAPRASPGVRSR